MVRSLAVEVYGILTHIFPVMENQMEKELENDVETAGINGDSYY